MKQKLIDVLKAKYSGRSNSVYEAVAKQLLPKITTEDQIEATLNDADQGLFGLTYFMDQVQAETDRRVTDAISKVQKPKEETPKVETPKVEPAKPGDEPPAWAQAFMQTITGQVSSLQKGIATKSLQEQLEIKLSNHGKDAAGKATPIPVYLAAGVPLEKPEDVDAAYNEAVTRFSDMRQNHITTQVDQTIVPGQPMAGQNPKLGAIKIDEGDFLKKYNEEHKAVPAN